MVLGCKAGICQITINMPPFLQASIIEHLQFVCDDKRDYAICQTLLEYQQASNPSITILKGMNLLKAHMKVKDIFKSLGTMVIIVVKQSLWLCCSM